MIRKRDKTNRAVYFSSCIHHSRKAKQEETKNPELFFKDSRTIRHYYESISHHDERSRFSCDCLALRLARVIIANISTVGRNSVDDGLLSEVFYCACIESANRDGLASLVKDPELLLVYIKQMVLLLRNAGVISIKKSGAEVKKTYEKDFAFLIDLFDSFWNRCSWRKLFPSDPDAASRLKSQRSILKDIVLSTEYRTDVGKLSNDFFSLTGFAPENDLFMISFLDFYVFTWFKHFGLIRYFTSGNDAAVSFEITAQGKVIFSAVS